MITVAIISPVRYQESVNDVLAYQDFGCSFRTYAYDRLTDIDRICAGGLEGCNVVLFTGELGYHYMLSHYPDYPIPCDFTVYGVADVLSILLSFQIRHPEVPLNRLYLDFLTPLNNYLHIQDYLTPDQLPYFFEEGNYDYTNITNRAIRLWREGRIDYVISRSINNLAAWEKQGIPYEAVYPTEPMIRKSIEEAVNRERLKKLEDYSVVTFIVHLPDTDSASREEKEYRMATLFKYLVDFRKERGLSYSIQQGFDRFVCRTTLRNPEVKELDFRKIVHLFQEKVDFPFSIGIGVHGSEQTSQYHAERALLESNRYGTREGFLVSGEPEVTTGPLSRSLAVRYSYQDVNVTHFARKLGIGNANLLRLVGLYRNDPEVTLSAAELGPILGVTLRSTRRILQKLCDMGIITPTEDIPQGSRGRPMHLYKFVSEALERALMTPEK